MAVDIRRYIHICRIADSYLPGTEDEQRATYAHLSINVYGRLSIDVNWPNCYVGCAKSEGLERETTSSTERIGGTIEGAEKVKDLKLVAILVGFFQPSNSVKFNKTYGNLEFISPVSRAILSSARAWFKQYGSVLAEITNEEFLNLMVRFVDGFELYDTDKHLIVNAKGNKLSA